MYPADTLRELGASLGRGRRVSAPTNSLLALSFRRNGSVEGSCKEVEVSLRVTDCAMLRCDELEDILIEGDLAGGEVAFVGDCDSGIWICAGRC